MKTLFICTSNKDRSPALEAYFTERHPHHEFRSAGINKYFCEKKQTHYLTTQDLEWADILVFAEGIHLTIAMIKSEFKKLILPKETIVLNLGEYTKGNIENSYLVNAEKFINKIIKL